MISEESRVGAELQRGGGPVGGTGNTNSSNFCCISYYCLTRDPRGAVHPSQISPGSNGASQHTALQPSAEVGFFFLSTLNDPWLHGI